MKKALALFLALCMMFALCACGKEAITADTFAERLEGMGLLVFLNDEEIDGAMVKNAYVGGSEEEDPIVWFYELDSKERQLQRSDHTQQRLLQQEDRRGRADGGLCGQYRHVGRRLPGACPGAGSDLRDHGI